MQCEAIADVLPGVVDGSAALDRSQRRHVEQCLRCQAELAQYRKLLRAMHARALHRRRLQAFRPVAAKPPACAGFLRAALAASFDIRGCG